MENLSALYDAAMEGDVDRLISLVTRDPHILDRCMIQKYGNFIQSPLHIAVNLGHFEFTKKILDVKKELAQTVDDLQRSALHLAVAKGHLQILNALLTVNPCACLARDQDGRNPIHFAAIRGDLQAFDKLFEAYPQAAREVTNRNESVLHLCVKYNKMGSLEHLVNVTDDSELLNFRDSAGNTALHLAVATRQTQMVRFLMGKQGIERNAVNTAGLTAMDMSLKWEKKEEEEIKKCLNLSGALTAKVALKPHNKDRWSWLEKRRNALMVVASLIATMAFQVGTNPPGGVWSEDTSKHSAGDSIFSYDLGAYKVFLIANTTSLISSLSVILLLISGIPYNQFSFVVLSLIMWIAISAAALTYLFSVTFLCYDAADGTVETIILSSILIWLLVVALLLLAHIIRFIKKLVRFVKKQHHNVVDKAKNFRCLTST